MTNQELERDKKCKIKGHNDMFPKHGTSTITPNPGVFFLTMYGNIIEMPLEHSEGRSQKIHQKVLARIFSRTIARIFSRLRDYFPER